MNLSQKFRRFHLEKVRLNTALVRADITFVDDDRDAAWELYIEMLTRIVTQPLPSESGDEATALDSVYSLFGITREILRRRGRRTVQFSKVAIPVLNQIVRPFTAKWHRESLAGAFDTGAGTRRVPRRARSVAGGVAKLQPHAGRHRRRRRFDGPGSC